MTRTTMRPSVRATGIRPPIQAPPIHRDGPGERAREPRGGLTAAQSSCRDLTGTARQMCYASQYGVYF